MSNTYLNTDKVAQEINTLTKKTSMSQLQIGKLVLNVKEDYMSQKSDIELKLKGLSNNKSDKDAKKQLKNNIELLNEEYNSFIDSLPFGKKVADKFAAIASDKLIAKYIDIAPVAYNTLYSLINTTESMWKFYKEKGVTSYSSANEFKKLKAEYIKDTSDPVDSDEEDFVANYTKDFEKESELKDLSDFKVDEPEVDNLIDIEEVVTINISSKVNEKVVCQLYDEIDAMLQNLVVNNNLQMEDIYIEGMNLPENDELKVA